MTAQYISYYILLLIVFVIGVVRYKRLTIPFKVLTVLMGLTLLLEIIAKICAIRYRKNAPVIHITSLVEVIFYSLTYYYLFKNKAIKTSILVTIVLITIFAFINSLWLQPYYSDFPSNLVITSEILYTIFSLLLFKQMLLYPLPINITKQSVFWYNTAMLLFSTTTFLNLGLINYYVKHHLNDRIIFDFYFGINMIFYALIGISILINNNKTISENV